MYIYNLKFYCPINLFSSFQLYNFVLLEDQGLPEEVFVKKNKNKIKKTT